MSIAHSAPEHDPRVYFAAERTFLAWIRTGLGLMGVGFAVSRFSLFLRELPVTQTHLQASSGALPRGSGVALVMLGVLVNGGAALRHVAVVRALRQGTWQPGRVSTPAVALAAVLALGGLALALFLSVVH